MSDESKITEDNTKEVFSMVENSFKSVLTKATLMVERSAKEFCPVDTGTLRRSITHQIDETTAIVGTNIEYAPHQELGTSKMAAHPFLRPALAKHIKTIKRMLRKVKK